MVVALASQDPLVVFIFPTLWDPEMCPLTDHHDQNRAQMRRNKLMFGYPHHPPIIPSGYVKIAMERSTIFNGKIHY